VNGRPQTAAPSLIRQLKAAYGAKEALDRTDSVVSRFLYRPLSFYLSVPFARFGWSPNQVTLFGFILALIGMIFLGSGTRTGAVAGSLLCFFQVLLDYVDGNLARLQKKGSHLGKFIDGIVDTFIASVLPIAVAVGVYTDYVRRGEMAPAEAKWILVIGGITGVAIALQSLLVYRLRAARFEASSGTAQPTSDRGAPVSSRTRSILGSIDHALRTEAFFMLLGLVLFALADALLAYLIIRCVARVSALAVETARTLVIARRDLGAARAY
jgi:phosphatidylglycerophosphate synthase